MAERRVDRVRVAVWSVAAALGATLGFAGFVYEPPPDVGVVFSGAEFKARLGLFDEARVELEEVLRRDPEHHHAHLLMAFMEHLDGHAAAALAHYEAGRPAIEAAGDPRLDSEWHVATGLLRLATRDFDGAMDCADRVIERSLRPAAGHLIRAFSRLGRGDDTGFRRELEQAYALDPYDPLFRARGEMIAEAIPWSAAFSMDPAGEFPAGS